MEGVTILYTYTYTPGKIEFIFCLCMFAAFIAMSMGTLLTGNKGWSFIATVAALIFLIGCIFTFSLMLNSRERYEVIIDDSIDFSEFSEKYKAIEIRGEIYTIEERNSEPFNGRHNCCSNCGAKMEQGAR